MNESSHSASYAAAGVDVTAGYKSVELMKKFVKSTYNAGVLQDIGGFGGLFKPDMTGIEEPVLVSGTDGVGTKLKIAFLLDKHDTVGIDCVAMCVNDIICCGASPLLFLDYIATGKLIPEKIAEIVKGVSDGCILSGAALIGGETAEMPGFYSESEYDLAGFAADDRVCGSRNCGSRRGSCLLGLIFLPDDSGDRESDTAGDRQNDRVQQSVVNGQISGDIGNTVCRCADAHECRDQSADSAADHAAYEGSGHG